MLAFLHVPMCTRRQCGFREDHPVNLYTSPDLMSWTFRGNVFATRPEGKERGGWGVADWSDCIRGGTRVLIAVWFHETYEHSLRYVQQLTATMMGGAAVGGGVRHVHHGGILAAKSCGLNHCSLSKLAGQDASQER